MDKDSHNVEQTIRLLKKEVMEVNDKLNAAVYLYKKWQESKSATQLCSRQFKFNNYFKNTFVDKTCDNK